MGGKHSCTWCGLKLRKPIVKYNDSLYHDFCFKLKNEAEQNRGTKSNYCGNTVGEVN
jgi:hypothetical protein